MRECSRRAFRHDWERFIFSLIDEGKQMMREKNLQWEVWITVTLF